MYGIPSEREMEATRDYVRRKLADYNGGRGNTPPPAGEDAPIPWAGDWAEPERPMDDMRLSPSTAAHEAAHAMLAGVLGIGATAFVREDGSGQCQFHDYPSELRDKLLLAVSGTAGEAVLYNQSTRDAVDNAWTREREGDGARLRDLLRDTPQWQHGPLIYEATRRAIQILRDPHNRPQFDELRARLAQGYRIHTTPEAVQ